MTATTMAAFLANPNRTRYVETDAAAATESVSSSPAAEAGESPAA